MDIAKGVNDIYREPKIGDKFVVTDIDNRDYLGDIRKGDILTVSKFTAKFSPTCPEQDMVFCNQHSTCNCVQYYCEEKNTNIWSCYCLVKRIYNTNK